MPLDTPPKLIKKRRLAFGLETTTGTAVALTAADAVTPIINPSMPFATESVEREVDGSLSPYYQGLGARSGTCDFETEIFGGSGAVPQWARLLRGCGCVEATDVFTPVSGATETLTIGHYMSGLLKKLVGCMGNCVMTFPRGRAGRARWAFTGVQDRVSDTAIIAPTTITTDAPRCAGTFTIGGANYIAPEVVFDMGNTVILREHLTAVDSAGEPTGYRAAYITGRRSTVTVAPEALPLSTKDWYDVFRDKTTSALILTAGDAGNGYTLAAPKMQLITDPTEEDRQGMLAHGLTFLCLGNSDAGDNEWSFTFDLA